MRFSWQFKPKHMSGIGGSHKEHGKFWEIRRDFWKTEQFSDQHVLACVQNHNIQGKWLLTSK